MVLPGPPELGRSVVVPPATNPPEPWSHCPRLRIDLATLADPTSALTTLQSAWFEREPLVVEVGVSAQDLQDRQTCLRPVHELDPRFEFSRERLHFLVWANSYDARSGDPIWWHGRKAARWFAQQGVTETGPADIELADGTALYVDGGPFAPTQLPSGVGIVHRWNTEAGSLSAVGHLAPDADLAPDQLAAVSHAKGGARVIAPAGSGKTRVLTERLRHLVAGRGADPSTVTALAYNRRAADELIERSATGGSGRRPHIRTLNSMGQWICDTHGGQGRLRVMEEPAVRELIQTVFEVRRQANTDTVLPFIDALSSVRLGLHSPRSVEEMIPDAQGLDEGFETYRTALAEAGALDFDEQIYRAIEILLARPRRPHRRATSLPPSPGRRVPGSQRCPHAPHPVAVRPGLFLFRCRRRRSGHLWLLRRHTRISDQLRGLLLRVRRTTHSRSTTGARRRSWGRPHRSCRTT